MTSGIVDEISETILSQLDLHEVQSMMNRVLSKPAQGNVSPSRNLGFVVSKISMLRDDLDANWRVGGQGDSNTSIVRPKPPDIPPLALPSIKAAEKTAESVGAPRKAKPMPSRHPGVLFLPQYLEQDPEGTEDVASVAAGGVGSPLLRLLRTSELPFPSPLRLPARDMSLLADSDTPRGRARALTDRSTDRSADRAGLTAGAVARENALRYLRECEALDRQSSWLSVARLSPRLPARPPDRARRPHVAALGPAATATCERGQCHSCGGFFLPRAPCLKRRPAPLAKPHALGEVTDHGTYPDGGAGADGLPEVTLRSVARAMATALPCSCPQPTGVKDHLETEGGSGPLAHTAYPRDQSDAWPPVHAAKKQEVAAGGGRLCDGSRGDFQGWDVPSVSPGCIITSGERGSIAEGLSCLSEEPSPALSVQPYHLKLGPNLPVGGQCSDVAACGSTTQDSLSPGGLPEAQSGHDLVDGDALAEAVPPLCDISSTKPLLQSSCPPPEEEASPPPPPLTATSSIYQNVMGSLLEEVRRKRQLSMDSAVQERYVPGLGRVCLHRSVEKLRQIAKSDGKADESHRAPTGSTPAASIASTAL